MDQWFDSLTEEQLNAIKDLDESQVLDYLADQGIELPDEALEQLAGGVAPKLFLQWMSRKIQGIFNR